MFWGVAGKNVQSPLLELKVRRRSGFRCERVKEREPTEIFVMRAEVGEADVGFRGRVDCGLEWGDQAGVWRAWARALALERKAGENFPRKSGRPGQ